MKIRYYLALAAAALVMTNCSQEEELVQSKQNSKGFTATIEGASRSAVTDAGIFSWTLGDKISVYNGYSFDEYTNSSEALDNFQPSAGAGTATGYAIYPAGDHRIDGEATITINVDLPNTYAHGSTNAPMLATIEQGSTSLSFKHLAGLMRFTVKNVPTGATKFIFTTTNNILTGKYKVIDDVIRQNGEGTADSSNNKVTITFNALTSAQDMIFYVPLPIGTYGEYMVQIENEAGTLGLTHTSTGVENTIARKTLLLMPTFTCNGSDLTKGDAIDGVIKLAEGSQVAAIVDNAEVVVTAGDDADATATLNYTPANDGSSVLSLSDGSAEGTTSTESAGKVQVATAAGSTVASCDIDMPTMTVELSAATGTTATYAQVTALTANNTLIIGDGVTVTKLILLGGNVRSNGTITTIEDANQNAYTWVTTIEALNTAISAGDNIILGANIISSEIITIDKPLTLNGNGYTLTSTAGRAINIETTGTVNIKNLNIVAAERAINIINEVSTVNLNKVTAIANNNAVMIATSAGAVNLTVEECDFTGLAVVNVAGAGAQVTITDTKITNTDSDKEVNYGAITVYTGALNVLVTVKGGQIFVADDSKAGFVFESESEITFNDTEGDNNIGYINYTCAGYGYEDISEAIEEAESGQTILLKRDVTFTEAAVIGENKNIIFDINGYDITATNCDAFEVQTGGILTIEGTEESIVSAGGSPSVCAVWANGGTIVINGGYFKASPDNEGFRNDCIYVGTNKDASRGGSITINGGKFEFTGSYTTEKNEVDYDIDKDGDRFLLNIADNNTTGSIVVNAGSFKNYAPSHETTGGNEIQLGADKKVYVGDTNTEKTEGHTGNTDIWYTVK